MELNRAVAENIKRIRKTQKLSLERTAAAAGVSRSMLGQIERGEANPSVAILGKLAAALKVPAEEFLRCDAFEPFRQSKELDTLPDRIDGGRVLFRRSMPYEQATGIETAFVDLYVNGVFTPEPSVTGALCTVTMIAGTGLLTVDGEGYTLLERDALRFAADQPWTLAGQGNGTARAYLIWQYREREGI